MQSPSIILVLSLLSRSHCSSSGLDLAENHSSLLLWPSVELCLLRKCFFTQSVHHRLFSAATLSLRVQFDLFFYIFWGFFNVHLCQGTVSQCCFFMYACVPPENPIVSVSGLTLWLTENPILLKEWLWLPCLVSCCANTHTVNLLFSVSLTPSRTYKSEPISYYSFPLLLSSLNPILLCTLILTPFPQHLAFVINVIYCDRD